MKKAWRYWLAISAAFLICGAIHLYHDWLFYNSSLNSAPFSLWIWVNAVMFALPAAVCALVGWILWRKNKKRKG